MEKEQVKTKKKQEIAITVKNLNICIKNHTHNGIIKHLLVTICLNMSILFSIKIFKCIIN